MLLRRPLFFARLIVVCSMILVFWSFVSYVKMRELVDLGISLNHRDTLIERKKKERVADLVASSTFNPVDRSPLHLYAVALAWGKKHGIESSVQSLYSKSIQKDEVLSSKKRAKRTVGRRNSRRSQGVYRSRDYAPLKSDVWEPRFIWPIERSQWRLSSPFGPRRLRGRRGFHQGIDMAAARGTPVKSVGDGVVVVAGPSRGYGNVVVVEHDDRFRTRYAHLSAITTRVGCEVKEGDMIGRVGATGHVVGRKPTHLHFEVEVSGRRMNPFYFLKTG